MHIQLQQTGAGLPAPRFIRLMLEQDLFGAWELIRESGQLGGRSHVRREQFSDRASAVEAFEKARTQHVKRGFVPYLSACTSHLPESP